MSNISLIVMTQKPHLTELRSWVGDSDSGIICIDSESCDNYCYYSSFIILFVILSAFYVDRFIISTTLLHYIVTLCIV